MTKVVTIDLGPTFIGQGIQIDGELVCVVSPDVSEDSSALAQVRDMMRRQGTDCRKCRGCQVGTAP